MKIYEVKVIFGGYDDSNDYTLLFDSRENAKQRVIMEAKERLQKDLDFFRFGGEISAWEIEIATTAYGKQERNLIIDLFDDGEFEELMLENATPEILEIFN